jgi:hypothetical protein
MKAEKLWNTLKNFSFFKNNSTTTFQDILKYEDTVRLLWISFDSSFETDQTEFQIYVVDACGLEKYTYTYILKGSDDGV